MADEADKATDHIEREMAVRIAAARGMGASRVAEYCDNECGEKAQPGGHYCSADCARDHEHRMKMQRINGWAE